MGALEVSWEAFWESSWQLLDASWEYLRSLLEDSWILLEPLRRLLDPFALCAISYVSSFSSSGILCRVGYSEGFHSGVITSVN